MIRCDNEFVCMGVPPRHSDTGINLHNHRTIITMTTHCNIPTVDVQIRITIRLGSQEKRVRENILQRLAFCPRIPYKKNRKVKPEISKKWFQDLVFAEMSRIFVAACESPD